YVGPNDLTMMYSVVDVAGLNAISRRLIGNAGNAAAGMARNAIPASRDDLPGIGMTMFGVTTSCVTQIREMLGKSHGRRRFHASCQ
ncbi:Tm-1-like ATP-binding domain-containing protein, partial [Rhizobium johnstonii]|uniref:Tm-1-like ATP-binding domain-containing protein n=1 Tax=Rhizobium johnstonii TaxID=3019933 RepID=UPI003F98FE89